MEKLWLGIGISIAIGYFIQAAENKRLEKRIDKLEDIEGVEHVTGGTGW